jgi:hypothetical protein
MITDENHQPVHRFILHAIDPTLGCPVLEALLRVADVETLRTLLGADAAGDADLRHNYVLGRVRLRAITERFEVAFDPQGRECWLSRAHSIGDAPYLVHTGYELPLMLDGVKPFAKFTVEYPVEPDDFQEDALFEPHVRSGLLINRVMDEPFDRPIRSSGGRIYDGVRKVFYARRGEEWRINAYILLWRQLDHGPWNETLERLDGALLGYTDEQNDWWRAHRRKNNASGTYTDRTAYIAVDATELAWIRAVGERALKPERSGVSLELVMHMPRPAPVMLQRWLAETDAAATVSTTYPVAMSRISLTRIMGSRGRGMHLIAIKGSSRGVTYLQIVCGHRSSPEPRRWSKTYRDVAPIITRTYGPD